MISPASLTVSGQVRTYFIPQKLFWLITMDRQMKIETGKLESDGKRKMELAVVFFIRSFFFFFAASVNVRCKHQSKKSRKKKRKMTTAIYEKAQEEPFAVRVAVFNFLWFAWVGRFFFSLCYLPFFPPRPAVPVPSRTTK